MYSAWPFAVLSLFPSRLLACRRSFKLYWPVIDNSNCIYLPCIVLVVQYLIDTIPQIRRTTATEKRQVSIVQYSKAVESIPLPFGLRIQQLLVL